MDNTLKKGKKRGERELKNTTKIKMEKKERKKKHYIFFPFMEILWKKRIYFGILQSLRLLIKKELHFIVFPNFEKEALHFKSRRGQRLG